MDNQVELAEQFDRSRGHLRAVAYRMLGSIDEAEDAVQETWLRASRVDATTIGNLPGWLTTIASRVCLDLLRARQRRREAFADLTELDLVIGGGQSPDPETEAVLADSVGLALLAVLDTLGPLERIAFVLHDMFAVPFEELAEIVERSPVATKKLASRARQRVRGPANIPTGDLGKQRTLVETFIAATRSGDLDAILAVLAPDVVRRADRAALRRGGETEVRGADLVATQALTYAGMARFARPILVNGGLGIVVAPGGRLRVVFELTFAGDRITAIDVTGDPNHIRQLQLAVLDPPTP